MAKILILESDEDLRQDFRDLVAEKGLDAYIAALESEALGEMKRGGVEVFRTNYINNNGLLSGRSGILYSRAAIKEALQRGIKVEIGTVSDFEDVRESLEEQKNLFFTGVDIESIHVVPKVNESWDLITPGESFATSKKSPERE